MVLGAYEIIVVGRFLFTAIKTMVIIVLEFVMTLMSIECISRNGLQNIRGYFVSAISYLYTGTDEAPAHFMWKACIVSCILMCIAVLIIYGTKNRLTLLVMVLVAVEMVTSLKASETYTDNSGHGIYRDIAVAEKAEELKSENPDRRIVYVVEDDYSFISVMQFIMREEKIELMSDKGSLSAYTEEELRDDDILLLTFQTKYADEAAQRYANHILNGHFYVFYNR
jgi:hypothetical protein